MKITSIAAFGPVVRDADTGTELYGNTLGLLLKREDNGYAHTSALEGARHFAVMPLAVVAQTCFGAAAWPTDIPAPSSWIAFDVDDVPAATKELQAAGCNVLVAARKEPWGEGLVTWFLMPDGVLIKMA